jgi:hypothetical protein
MFINAAGDHSKSTLILPLTCLPKLDPEHTTNFDITLSKKGWIDGETLKTMIEEVFVRRISIYRQQHNLVDKYVLLILDNHSSRNSLDEERLKTEHKIIILYIPPHSSALLQLLDLGPNLTLKQVYSKIYRSEKDENMEKRRNRSLYALHLAETMALTEYTIINSWLRAGLWPINSKVVTKSCMVKPEPNFNILGKRGPKLSRGDVLIDGTTIVHHGQADKEIGQPDKENVPPANKKKKTSK